MGNDDNMKPDTNSEMFVHHLDPSNLMLATQKLNGENFTQWKRSVEISLIVKNKICFVKGTCKKPSDKESITLWEINDNLVISWLLHSVEASIANSVLYCKTSLEIWKELEVGFG